MTPAIARTTLYGVSPTVVPTIVLAVMIFSVTSTLQAQSKDPLEKAVSNAVQKVSGSVVRIETIGGLERVDGNAVGRGASTGLIVEQGYALSSEFNFVHQPAAIFARLPNNERVHAEIVGRDELLKLVLLKLDTSQTWPKPTYVDRSKLQVGQTVIAVGKCYDASAANVSIGILSARNRIWGRTVQTDAKISAANYGGPLIDLYGNVIGVLAPLSPDNDQIMAGPDWYDSGIGFAVPLDRILQRLDLLKSGKTLRAGLTGLAFKGNNIYADSAEVGYCHGSSPASIAGVRVGDVVVEANGIPILRQAQLKHVLGPFYEDETVEMIVQRNDSRLPVQVKLVGELAPFVPLRLGMLVESNPGFKPKVKYVFPNSPADAAGLLTNDLIVSLDGNSLLTQETIADSLLGKNENEIVVLEVIRADASLTKEVLLQKQSAEPPVGFEVPSATETIDLDIRVPEFKNRALAIIPQGATSKSGLLVWASAAGRSFEKEELKLWRSACSRNNVVLLVVHAAATDKWHPDEIDFTIRAIQLLRNQANIAPARVGIGGWRSGGAMAALTAFKHRELFRGLILLDATIPDSLQKLETQAINPFLVYLGGSETDEQQAQLDDTIQRLESAQIPTYVGEAGPELSVKRVEELLKWVQSLDRI